MAPTPNVQPGLLAHESGGDGRYFSRNAFTGGSVEETITKRQVSEMGKIHSFWDYVFFLP